MRTTRIIALAVTAAVGGLAVPAPTAHAAKTTNYYRIEVGSPGGPLFVEALGDRPGQPLGLQRSRPTDPRQQWALLYTDWPTSPRVTDDSPPAQLAYRYKLVNRYAGRCLSIKVPFTQPATLTVADCVPGAPVAGPVVTRRQTISFALPGRPQANIKAPLGPVGRRRPPAVHLRIPYSSGGCLNAITPASPSAWALQMPGYCSATDPGQRVTLPFVTTVTCGAAGPVFQCGMPRQGSGP